MALGKKKVVVDDPVAKAVVAGTPKAPKEQTKSANIVKLYTTGMPIADIASKLGIRYEFAYQVSKRHALAVGKPFSTNRVQGDTKADKIRELYDKGMTIAQIAKELKTHNSYVWQVTHAYKESKAS